jgi:hypothetical protein
VVAGQTLALLTLPVHAFANLGVSPDGIWLYFTQVANSDQLYRYVVHSSRVTNELLTRYGPRTDVMRIPSAGGRTQIVARDGGQVAVPGAGGS